ncbi:MULTISPECIES: AAA family ATPase [Enterobacter cloacae complex]|uniref:AAA family ATPase n=1 Tax=Enterobacter cloacae complex TaxID=354276 RepID=UPI000FEBC12E|nr:AAA family ATPase [Enterobacter cloacae]MCM7883700.1 AAA family ATPase [Enterobacter sichuanensis]RWT27944.1 AAA family ATPase [Enterobacter cloacae]VAX69988.1 Predicted ATP-binding protein involved in virulence [Enterobacter cloacae]
MANSITKLRSMNVESFRGLKNVNISFGERITVICGKNGTSKSTILGIIAQIFSFSRDYSKDPAELLGSYRTLTGNRFKSQFSEHFRFSSKFDTPGGMEVQITLYDGAFEKELNNLRLGLVDSTYHQKARPVLRNNDVLGNKNTSRNVTHPVIYLSLQRLLPITLRPEYSERDVQYIIDNKKEILSMNRRLLIKENGTSITATTGTIDSMVVHGDNYDHESVSVGEDNVGQIIQAIFSFKRLKDELKDYHGGMLLIDEADAGLFPAAQIELINVLKKMASKLDLQIVMTSHSPILIEEVFKLSKVADKDYRTVYLTDTYGPISAKTNLSWPEINADLLVDTIKVDAEEAFPKINIYFEDFEAYLFFKQLITERHINKILTPLKDVNISCSTMLDLMARKIPEFINKSIIVLDGDVVNDNGQNAKKAKSEKSLCLLPTTLPPDQLLFEFLYNLDKKDLYWQKNQGFTRQVFIRISGDIIDRLNIVGEKISLEDIIKNYRKGKSEESVKGELRKLFKAFAQNDKIRTLLTGPVSKNPFRYWINQNPELKLEFKKKFEACLINALISGFGIDSGKVYGYLQIDN